MKKCIKLNIIVLVFYVSPISLYFNFPLIYAQSNSDKLNHRLKIDFSFPKETDNVLLGQPTLIEIDEEGNIYICDYHLSTILKYSSDGQFLQSIGQAGKGPGEFTNQSRFTYWKSKLYIIDQSNRRLQIISKTGEYLNSFSTKTIPTAIAVTNNKIYVVITKQNKPNQSKLISVFDEKGNCEVEFGEFLHFVDNFPANGSSCILKIFRDHIYVLFRYYPIMRIYSLKGKLIKQLEFDELDYKKMVSGNYVFSRFTKKNQRSFSYKFLFNALDITEEGIWLGLYHPDIRIDHYDFSGKLVDRYVLKHTVEDIYLLDIKVQNLGKRKFYILNEEIYSKLDICSAKNAK